MEHEKQKFISIWERKNTNVDALYLLNKVIVNIVISNISPLLRRNHLSPVKDRDKRTARRETKGRGEKKHIIMF